MSGKISKKQEHKEFEQEIQDAIEEAFDGDSIESTIIFKEEIKERELYRKQKNSFRKNK